MLPAIMGDVSVREVTQEMDINAQVSSKPRAHIPEFCSRPIPDVDTTWIAPGRVCTTLVEDLVLTSKYLN